MRLVLNADIIHALAVLVTAGSSTVSATNLRGGDELAFVPDAVDQHTRILKQPDTEGTLLIVSIS